MVVGKKKKQCFHCGTLDGVAKWRPFFFVSLWVSLGTEWEIVIGRASKNAETLFGRRIQLNDDEKMNKSVFFCFVWIVCFFGGNRIATLATGEARMNAKQKRRRNDEEITKTVDAGAPPQSEATVSRETSQKKKKHHSTANEIAKKSEENKSK